MGIPGSLADVLSNLNLICATYHDGTSTRPGRVPWMLGGIPLALTFGSSASRHVHLPQTTSLGQDTPTLTRTTPHSTSVVGTEGGGEEADTHPQDDSHLAMHPAQDNLSRRTTQQEKKAPNRLKGEQNKDLCQRDEGPRPPAPDLQSICFR